MQSSSAPHAGADRPPRSIAQTLADALRVAVTGGLLIGAALGFWTAWLNGWAVSADALILCGHLAVLYSAVFAVGLGLAALAARALDRQLGPRTFWGLLVGFCVLLSGVLRFNPATQLAAVVPSLNLMGVIDLTVISIASAAAFTVVTAANRKRRLGALAVAALCLGGLEALHLWHERPIYRDLRSAVPALPAADAEPPAAAAEQFENARVVVLGFDGLTWENLLPLMRRGELPHFRAFLGDAAYGYLDTLETAVSPIVWETISSGRTPADHGIGHHTHFDFWGLTRRVTHLPTFRLCDNPMGLRRLLVATHRFAPWKTVQASGLDSRAARLWEIASAHEIPVGTYRWYNSGPAVPVLGFMHSTRALQPADHPPDLESGLPPLPPKDDIDPRTRPAGDPGLSPYEMALWSRFVTHALRHRPALAMYYTQFGDGANHLNWKYEQVGASLFLPGWRHPDFEPGPMITAAHHLFDEILGDVMRRVPEQAVVVVASDHGFDFRGYEHDNAPPGVILMRGPGIQPGVVDGASVYDVAPTLLHLLGLAAAQNMPGSVLAAAGGAREERIASYGGAASAKMEAKIDEEEMAKDKAYLKSLGYVVD